MTDPEPTPRTPEQQDAVRRRSRTLSLCGLFCGILGLVLLLSKTIAVDHPPMVFAVNLSFCAMMIGIGILFYIKGTPGVTVARAASIVAIVSGIAGPLVFSWQSMIWHQQVEHRELGNAESIAKGATAYARRHDGQYPDALVTLLCTGDVPLENMNSPFGSMIRPQDMQRLRMELVTLQQFNRAGLQAPEQALTAVFAQEINKLGDYQYFGTGLTLPNGGADPKATLPEEIILASSRNAIMRTNLTVAFADGRATFLDQGDAEAALTRSNNARTSLGFDIIRPPEVIQRAQKYKNAPSAPGN
jgi:hypothetical protein